MATLMLSSLGSAIAGPLGAALGGLAGQRIDSALFGSGATRGPRLGDLSVQTSSYGNFIPQVYGKMRLAGTVVWATDLQEESELQAGAKGDAGSAPYSYSVSLAVAISSRPILGVGRIWADGQLLRGAQGDFKVRTTFRLHLGLEDQEPDPLIASLEGVGKAPAFRGLAVAVFEDLDLTQFGNRIPVLNFEVIADEAPLSAETLIEGLSSRSLAVKGAAELGGFAAYGSSRIDLCRQIADALNLQIQELPTPSAAIGRDRISFGSHELGCTSEGNLIAAVEREQKTANDLPSVVSVAYYDDARDFQAGLQKASAGKAGGMKLEVELPAAIEASAAKEVAERRLTREWTERTSVRLRLPPHQLSLRVGDQVHAPGLTGTWLVDKILIENLVVLADLRRATAKDSPRVAAYAGRSLAQPDQKAEQIELAVVELPDQQALTEPRILLAASGGTAPWRPVRVEVEGGGTSFITRTARKRAVLGRARQALGAGGTNLLDLVNSVEVEVSHADDWLQNCDDQALASGANLAALGPEIIQFGRAVPSGPGRFLLSRLLRGRAGTEWATAAHTTGERFLLLEPATLASVTLPRFLLGGTAAFTPGQVADEPTPVTRQQVTGESLRPLSPVHLRFRRNQDGTATAAWVRRSRLGWSWTDGADTPLGESTEAYAVRVNGSKGMLKRTTSAPSLVLTSEEVASLGDNIGIHVSQLGDFTSSQETSSSLIPWQEFAS